MSDNEHLKRWDQLGEKFEKEKAEKKGHTDTTNRFEEFEDPRIREHLYFVKKEKSRSSLAASLAVCRRYLPMLKSIEVPITEVTYDHVRFFVKEMVNEGLAKNTIESYISRTAQLHDYFEEHHGEQMTSVNRINLDDFDGIEDGEQRGSISVNRVEELIDAADHGVNAFRDNLLVSFYAQTGARRTEAIEVLTTDVNIEKGEVHIPDVKRGGRRPVPIPPSLEFKLDFWKNNLRESLYASAAESEYIFVGQGTEQIGGKQAYQIVRNAADRADLEDDDKKTDALGRPIHKVKPHVLRHSYATQLYKDGISLNHIRMILGHANIATTRNYIHQEEQAVFRDFHTNYSDLQF